MIPSARSERKTRSEVAGHKLRRVLTGGIYGPGSQLPTEAELCEIAGISRTVLREALRILEDDGLVAQRPGPMRLRVPSIEDSQ